MPQAAGRAGRALAVGGGGGDRAHLGYRDLLARVEDQAVLGAAGDFGDVLVTDVQLDSDTFVGAHRVQDAEDQLVRVAVVGGRRPRYRRRWCGQGVGGDRVADAVVQLVGGVQVAAVVVADVDVLDLAAVDAV